MLKQKKGSVSYPLLIFFLYDLNLKKNAEITRFIENL